MTLYDKGWTPKQAKEVEPGEVIRTRRGEEALVQLRTQHPLLGRMLVFYTDAGEFAYVKTAQVWVR